MFSWYYRKIRPQFATFFLNSTAHYQHLYWREMDPSAFTVQPTEAQRRNYRDAIEFGYRQMDGWSRVSIALAGNETTIVMATALSQQPCLMFEAHGGKYLLPADRMGPALTSLAGVTDRYKVSPVMAHQFHLYFDSAEAAERGAETAGDPLSGPAGIAVERNGAGLFVGCRVYELLSRRCAS